MVQAGELAAVGQFHGGLQGRVVADGVHARTGSASRSWSKRMPDSIMSQDQRGRAHFEVRGGLGKVRVAR